MATITISNTGGNWNATSSWVGGVIPTVADDVVATATSGNLTVTATAAALSINFTNYVGTFVVNSGITLTIGNGTTNTGGTFTMVSGMNVGLTSTGTLSFAATATLSSGGITWPGNIILIVTPNTAGQTRTFTLGSPWSVNGNLSITFGATSQSVILNSNSMTVRGNLTMGTSALGHNSGFSGTTNLILGTTTTQTVTTNILASITVVDIAIPVTFNSSGTIIITTPFSKLRFSTLTWTAGIVTTTGATLYNAGNITINTGGMTWDCAWILQGQNRTYTLASDFNISSLGSLTTGQTQNMTFNGSNINLNCNYTQLVVTLSGNLVGTTVMNLLGNCTISQQSGNTFRLPTIINSTGTVTFTSNFSHGASLTYTTGTFSMSNSLTWTNVVTATYTLNAPNFNFPNFVSSTNVTFAGSEGCSFFTYTVTTVGVTNTFQINETYTILSAITLTGTLASRVSFASSSANTNAILTVLQGASMDVGYANATDIDSSLGQTIWSYRGTLLRSTNWQQLPVQPKTVANFNI
jgi:hypothetical protein